MPYQQKMFILPSSLPGQFFNKGNKSILNIQKSFSALRFAKIVLIQRPVFGNFAMQFPAFFIRLVFQDATILFAQGIRDPITLVKRSSKDFRCLPGAQDGAGENRWDRNIS